MRDRSLPVLGLALLALGLFAPGCFDGDKYRDKLYLQGQYSCDTEADCIDEYVCDPQSKKCVPPSNPEDCNSIYYTANGLNLTVHFKEGDSDSVSISRTGLPAQGQFTTEPGAYSVTRRGKEVPIQAVVENASRLVKVKFGSCAFRCVGQSVLAGCVDEDCDGFGPQGCVGLDPDDTDPKVFPGAPEVCDGKDNDGDGQIDAADDGYRATSCPLQVGVCAGAVQQCVAGVLQMCDYGPDYVAIETDQYCDQKDNDCNGQTDERCACRDGETNPCGTVVGECEQGVQRCVSGHWDPVCEGSIEPRDEVCDCLDNDCDGTPDELPDNENGYVCGATCPDCNAIPIIATLGGAPVTICVDRHEASRRSPDNPNDLFPANVPGALPWTNVSFAQAQSACQLVNKVLCPIEVWKAACVSRDNFVTYPYGSDYRAGVCNGNNEAAGPQATASFPECISQWDPRGGGPAEIGRLFDMSGNVREWVAPPDGSPGDRYTMGGSYLSPPERLTCSTLEDQGNGTGAADIGFRCCSRR